MTASKHRIYFLLQRAAHRVRVTSDQLLIDELGITTAQAAALMIIESFGEVNQRTIAKELEQNESAITATVARLVKSGFIRKKRSKSDGRAWTLTLTNKGQSTLAQSRRTFGRINSALDTAMGETDTAELAETLTALSAL